MVKDIKKLIKKAMVQIQAMGTGALTGTAVTEFAILRAPCKGRVIRLGIVPAGTITGADTNSCTLGFKNKGSAGSGTDVMAQKAYISGINEVAFDFCDYGAVSYGLLNKDDVVTFFKSVIGTGLNTPGLIASAEFLPDFVPTVA